MLKQKISGSVQEVILPDFPDDDDNTVTTTVTKSRRVSFGPNFVKEFIVDSAISAQCMSEYEQPFPSSDSSNADSSHSAVGHSTFVMHENVKVHRSLPPEPELTENRTKHPKFASTICFSADSPTADMEFTEGCITLAKTILDKKNKEMTVFIQAKPKGPKEEEKGKEEETNYFEGSQFEMSMTRCLKSKEKNQEEKRFMSEKTRIFGKFDDEMSMTRCDKVFNDDESDSNWEESKENRMPLDAIMRHLDKDDSDSDLFNPERSFGQLLGTNSLDLSDESEKLNLNESMEISGDLQGLKLPVPVAQCEDKPSEMPVLELSEKLDSNELVIGSQPSQLSDDKIVSDELTEPESLEKTKITESPKANSLDVSENPLVFAEEVSAEETVSEDVMDLEASRNPSPTMEETNNAGSEGMSPIQEVQEVQEVDNPREPSLGDLKVIEGLKEQAKEKGCVWSLNDVQHPQKKVQGLLSFSCRLLESTTTLEFILKMSNEDSLDSCSVVTDRNILLDEEKQCRLPEYSLAMGFGFDELKKYFGSSQTVETIRHVPYYMDQVNSFLSKMNAYLLQIYSLLTSYPGSSLRGCRLSFRLFSFPIFFSCVVSIDLSNVFRLSKASLTFEHDFGYLDEKKVEEIFEECLKGENSLCEFVVQSTKYLVELERSSGYLSKRKHIRLLPDELKS